MFFRNSFKRAGYPQNDVGGNSNVCCGEEWVLPGEIILSLCPNNVSQVCNVRPDPAGFRFIRDHHRQIGKVAVVSDSAFLSMAPRIADHFVAAEVRHFSAEERDAAMRWLRQPRHGQGRD